MNIPGRTQINKLLDMDPARLAVLPAEELAAMQKEADALLLDAKTIKRLFNELLEQRYSRHTQNIRTLHGKDTGTVRFEDGPVTVTADLPKRVVWNQEQLAAMAERIRAGGEDPAEYVEIAFKVPERKFTAWPAHIRTAFEGARTVKTGKPVYRLSLSGRDAS